MFDPSKPILVTGATGYVGGRLVPRLLMRGYRVRAMSRSIDKLKSRPWATHEHVELVAADVMDEESLERACDGCTAVYYLVHSMAPGAGDFEEKDKKGARNMATAAARCGVHRLVYLGGLGRDDADLSKHLRSRHEVADELRAGEVPTTVFRAAVILGAGSASFEILRYLTERLPVMIAPRWLRTRNQPVSIRNVLHYLIECLQVPDTADETFDIGGPEILTYQQLIELYAEEAGLSRRLIIPVPVLTPKLSSYWIHLVTPAPAALAQPLAAGLKNEVIAKDNRIRQLIPQELIHPREAIRRAMDLTQHGLVETHWTDAGPIPPAEWGMASDADWTGGTVLREERRIVLDATPEEAWRPVVRIGGSRGWYWGDWLWRLRGRMDKLIGGVGLRRGRRDPDHLRPGDALDFWRVRAVEPAKRLVLVAEMRAPGEAILEFKLNRLDDNRTELVQTAKWLPHGLLGLAYWWAVYPLHKPLFRGMVQGIADAIGEDRQVTSIEEEPIEVGPAVRVEHALH